MGKAQYQSDSDSGLQLLGHRYYDPSIGRFLSSDPAKAGTNWYAYCDNNPLAETDAQGLDGDVPGPYGPGGDKWRKQHPKWKEDPDGGDPPPTPPPTPPHGPPPSVPGKGGGFPWQFSIGVNFPTPLPFLPSPFTGGGVGITVGNTGISGYTQAGFGLNWPWLLWPIPTAPVFSWGPYPPSSGGNVRWEFGPIWGNSDGQYGLGWGGGIFYRDTCQLWKF